MQIKGLIIIYLAISIINGDVCTDKNCTCTTQNSQTEIKCSALGFTEVPTLANLPKNVFVLDFSSNKIQKLGMLEELDGVKYLKLDHNTMDSIVPSAFSKYNYLESLDLSHNNLYTLDVTMLEGLSGLRSLNLSHNLLRKINEDLFDNMPDLYELNLSGNPLHYVRYGMFRKLTRVFSLDLSSAALDFLPPDVFHDMQVMTDLDLSDNNFDTVPLAGLQSAFKLRHLKLNGNNIYQLKENSFKKLKSLEVLELSDMASLQSIKAGAFSGLKLLRILKITNNKNLQSFDFGAFEGLYKFDDSWTLQELYLRQNDLNEILSPSTALCKIETLDLQGNPWDCDCKLVWLTACMLRTELTVDLKCKNPHNLENKLIREIEADEMVCRSDHTDVHQQKVLRIVVVSSGLVGLIFCAIIIVVVIKKRKIMEWWYYRKRGSGAVYYVKANAGPKDSTGEI